MKRTRRHTHIAVRCDRSGQPLTMRRGPYDHIIECVLEQWDVRGRWWGRESSRRYVIVRTDRGTFELCRDQGSGRWGLTGVAD